MSKMTKLKLVVTEGGDSSMGLMPKSWVIECPFDADWSKTDFREPFRKMIIDTYSVFVESGLVTARYDDEK